MLKKILAPLVTHRDSKGRKFMDIVGARYDKKELSEEEAQNVNEAPGLPELIDKFIERNRSGCLVPPEGCRVYILHKIKVQMDRDWQEAISVVGPGTLSNNNIRKVGDQYPPKSGVVEKADIILVNFNSGGSLERACLWADEHQFKKTNPRHIFAIGEKKPWLPIELGVAYVLVAATEKCLFEGIWCACNIWWNKPGRKCILNGVEDYGVDRSCYGGPSEWFAFIRE